jgi:NADPH:quinone reductase-like Zn-dependent oxidoreductase
MVKPQEHMVLVRVSAVRRRGPLVEFSGTVEGMGEGVTSFHAGDEVEGTADGIFADYVCVHSGSIRRVARPGTHL